MQLPLVFQALIAGLLVLIAGCRTGSPTQRVDIEPTGQGCVTLAEPQTFAALGSAQGVEFRNGYIYAYGDADVGVIRAYRFNPETGRAAYTNRELRLTVDGEDVIPHPTGLTHHPDHGTWLGNTVGGRGTLFLIDWAQAWEDGTLDNAILHRVTDDAAVNGTRPEFVRVGRVWLLATSDYGEQDNAVRLYDPQRLRAVERTMARGVVVRNLPCGPWVQNLHWLDADERLVLVQNQIAGLKWQLTFVRLDDGSDLRNAPTCRDFVPADELEGFHLLDPPRCMFITSSTTDNFWLGRLRAD